MYGFGQHTENIVANYQNIMILAHILKSILQNVYSNEIKY